jgi:hypothetical protein
MNTIARKLSIFVLMVAAATTALTMGATTTLAASNTHRHDIQLMGKDDSWASSFTHTPVNWTGDVGSGDFGGFNSAQYGGVQPHHHDSSTNMIVDYNGDNSNSTAGSDDRGGFNSVQYGGVQPHHHHSSTNMVADSGDNSNSTAGDFGDFNSAQYAWSHPHHHHSSMIVDYNGDNSNSTAGSDDRGGFSSTQYGSSDSHPHHHKDSTPNSSIIDHGINSTRYPTLSGYW